MTEEQNNIYMLAQIAVFNATIIGMQAENEWRKYHDQIPAYDEGSFQKVIDNSCIYHNAIIEGFGILNGR